MSRDALFEPADRGVRIFWRRGERRSTFGEPRPGAGCPGARTVPATRGAEALVTSDLEHLLLHEIAPACVVVDASGTALHFSGPVGRYLEPQGAPSEDVVELAREQVRLEVRSALRRAVRDGNVAIERCAPAQVDGHDELTEVVVRPLPSAAGADRARYLVAFRQVLLVRAAAPSADGAAASADEALLRVELAATRQRLQATTDELEASRAERRRTTAGASRARLEEIVDTVPHLIWTATADGTRDYFSRQWREYTGLSDGPQLDAGWIDAYHPDDRPAMLAAWAESVRSGTPFQAEYRIRRHDGVYRWFRARANPLRDGAGAVERWIGTSTDVDDVKRLEASLREGSRRKDEFMALLGHELRNPLAPLGNSLDILRRHGDREHVARATEVIDRQVTHLARLVDDLLDVSRITSGKIRIRRERLDLGALLGAIVDDHRALFAAAGVRLEAAAPRGPLWIDGDPARVAQMVGNLLQNARKFTERGGSVGVSVEPAADGLDVALHVRDTGIGMAPEIIDRMFEPFAQADSTLAHSRGGLGLGLTLVKALAELHGGTVRGASEGPGCGSEFELRLPLVDQPPAVIRPEAPASAARRILVVDDNVDAAETLAELLRLEGHEVRVAADGISGLEEARRFRPEIAFCDIGLPGELDGYALARALREEPGLEGTLLVAMTGYAAEEDQRRTREAGFALHFAKPARIATVAHAIATWRPDAARGEPATPDDAHAAAW